MPDLIIKIQISAAVILLVVAFGCLLLRRAVFWTLLGMSVAIKALVLGSFVAIQCLPTENSRALVLLILVGLSFLMIGITVSLAVVTRAQCFSSELEWEKETGMKH